MTIYSDLTETTDYDETFGSYTDATEAYEEPAASCCCGGEVEIDYDWPAVDPAPSVYDVPEDDASVWTDPQPAASAVIPAGQPGGPEIAPSVEVDAGWETPGAHQGLYPTVAPIGAHPVEAAPEVSGFGTGFSSYGTPAEPVVQTGFGTGFSALASTSDVSYSTAGFGTGFSALHTTSASPFATTMVINPEVNPLGQLIAKAANEGDILTQLRLGRVQAGQSWIGSSWL